MSKVDPPDEARVRAGRVTQRGRKPVASIPVPNEPAFSTRPTERDLSPLVAAVKVPPAQVIRGPRGQVSARGVSGASDTASGELDPTRPRRARTWSARSTVVGAPALDEQVAEALTAEALTGQVFLAMASKREIVVIVNGQELTLDRPSALALADVIQASFDGRAR